LIIFKSILKLSDKLQKDIFINLSDRGLTKLLNGIKDNNVELRKASAKALIDLISNNEVLQNIFCEKFNFNPIGSVICLNWFPKYLKEHVKIDENLILEIKGSFNQYQISKLKYWMWPYYKEYSDDYMPDPHKYLIGFYYANKNVSFFTYFH